MQQGTSLVCLTYYTTHTTSQTRGVYAKFSDKHEVSHKFYQRFIKFKTVSSHSKLIPCKVVIETTLESHTNCFHLTHAHNTYSLTNSRTPLHLTKQHTKTTFNARSQHPHITQLAHEHTLPH